jgi:hypothetical protein
MWPLGLLLLLLISNHAIWKLSHLKTRLSGWKQIVQISNKHNSQLLMTLFIYRLLVFSSSELKVQVSYSDRPLSVRLFVCPSVCKLLHFRLLLHNHWANFNQTWHKLSLSEGILNCSNEGDCPSPRGDNHKRVKIHWKILKIFFFRTRRPISIKLVINHP